MWFLRNRLEILQRSPRPPSWIFGALLLRVGEGKERWGEGTPEGWLTPPCSKSWKMTWSSVKFGGNTFLPGNIGNVWKINKMPEFYMVFARKNFSHFFWGGGCTPALPHLLLLWFRKKSLRITSRCLLNTHTKFRAKTFTSFYIIIF